MVWTDRPLIREDRMWRYLVEGIVFAAATASGVLVTWIRPQSSDCGLVTLLTSLCAFYVGWSLLKFGVLNRRQMIAAGKRPIGSDIAP